MTTNINNSPEYACRTCAKQECGCKDTECQLPCHFYTEQAEQEPVAWALSHSLGIEFGSKYPMRESKEVAEQMAREHMGNVVVTPLYAAPQPMKQEPVALPFNCWSTNDGDSWYEHPADAQLIYDTLGDDAKVGDEFEVTAGWTCVTARYRIVSQDDDDFEVECISHPQDNANPVRTKDLTDEEQLELARSSVGKSRHWLVAAVIAKLKEKNK